MITNGEVHELPDPSMHTIYLNQGFELQQLQLHLTSKSRPRSGRNCRACLPAPPWSAGGLCFSWSFLPWSVPFGCSFGMCGNICACSIGLFGPGGICNAQAQAPCCDPDPSALFMVVQGQLTGRLSIHHPSRLPVLGCDPASRHLHVEAIR